MKKFIMLFLISLIPINVSADAFKKDIEYARSRFRVVSPARRAVRDIVPPVLVKPYSVYFAPGSGPVHALVDVINGAIKTADLAIYSINDPDVTAAILAAAKRGVHVRLVCDKTESAGKNSATRTISKTNIPIHIQSGSGNGIMHIKMAIVDSEFVTLGSFNWTTRAGHMNDEVELVLHDPVLATQCQVKFESLWAGEKIKFK